jgi:hypothetical protein
MGSKLPLFPSVSRRQLLQMMGTGAAALAVPGCSQRFQNPATPGPTFFTSEERLQLAALANYVLPPDDAPGGADLGAVPYIETLLTCLEHPEPEIFLGGPYSGRRPFAGPDGTATRNFPANDYVNHVPPGRLALKAWRLYLYGSDSVGGAPNDHILGKVVGLRDQLRNGLKDAASKSPKPLPELDYAGLNQLWPKLDKAFADVLIGLVTQAAFGMPEYGGNPGGAGWAMVRYEGDILPLGFSFIDPATGLPRDNPLFPTSVAQPGPDPEPTSQASVDFLRTVFTALGGQEFP